MDLNYGFRGLALRWHSAACSCRCAPDDASARSTIYLRQSRRASLWFGRVERNSNTRLEVIPDRFVAPIIAMKSQPLMAAKGFERAPVEVNFEEAAKEA